MKRAIILLLVLSLAPLAFAAGDNWILSASDGRTKINGTDVCIDIDGVNKCLSAAGTGGGDITSVNTAGIYLTGGAVTGAVDLLLNETVLNATIDARAVAASDTNCSVAGSCPNVLYWDNESVLDVNSSVYWGNYNGTNSTHFENVNGDLTIVYSWLTSFVNALVGASVNPFDQVLNTTSNVTFNNISAGNITANYFIGDGSDLTNIQYTETDPLWTSNQSLYYLLSNPFGYYNSTDFNIADYRTLANFSFIGDNITSWSINPETSLTYDLGSGSERWRYLYVQNSSSDYADITYDLNVDGDISASTINATNITLKNLWVVNMISSGNNTADWFNGQFNWTEDSDYLTFNGSVLSFNETRLDQDIDIVVDAANTTMVSYVDAMNASQATVITAEIIAANATATSYTDSMNGSQSTWATNEFSPIAEPLSLHLNQDNWFNDSFGYIYWEDSDTIVFNQSKLETVFFNASAVDNVTGTAAGTNELLQTYDSISYNISEVASDIDFRVNFSGITEFNNLIVRYKTPEEDSGHILQVQIYEPDEDEWEDYGVLPPTTGYSIVQFGVYDEEDHIDGEGVVQVRFYQDESSGKTHLHEFDWVTISKGFGTPAGQEVDPLSIHKDGTVSLTGNWNAVLNISAEYFNGLFNWTTTLVSDYLTGSFDGYNLSIIINDTKLNEDFNQTATINSIGNWSADKGEYSTTTVADGLYVNLTGDTMSGNLIMGLNNFTNVSALNFNSSNLIKDNVTCIIMEGSTSTFELC